MKYLTSWARIQVEFSTLSRQIVGLRRCKSVAGARVNNVTRIGSTKESRYTTLLPGLQFVLVLDDLRNKILQGLKNVDIRCCCYSVRCCLSIFSPNYFSMTKRNIWREILRIEKNFNGFFCRQLLLVLKWCCWKSIDFLCVSVCFVDMVWLLENSEII